MTKHMPSPPARAQDALFHLGTDASPAEVFKAIGRLRRAARDEIDRLIRFLDDTEGHMELEDDGDDEPSLGFLDGLPGAGRGADRPSDDREADNSDDEPSLGSHELPSGAICYLPSVSFGEIDVEAEDDSGIGDLDGLKEQLSGKRFPSGLQIDGVE